MKKILLSSLLAVMAVTSANAKIASTEYADSVAESKAAAAETAAKSYTDAEVAKKQDVINDLSTIRAGASKGATAVQNFNSLTNEAEVTGTNDGNYVTSVTQTNGKIKASVVAFDTSLSADSTNAPQSKVVKSYVDNAIDGVNDVIGEGYQKLSDKLKSSDTTEVTETNKDTLYPTVGKTQLIADAAKEAAEAAAKSYTDAEVAKKQDVINDLSTIRAGASKGATAVQNFNSLTNEAEVTGTNDGNYVTSVTQTNGKIKASVVAFDTSLSADSTNAVQNKAVTAALNGKQDTLSTEQLAAVNSGITEAKVTTYDGYATGKQNTLSTDQLNAVNSGATAAIISATSAFQAAVEEGTVSEEGTYVLTAKVDAETKKVTGYAWENIDRSYE